ncbi:MAG: hypothetical protein ACI4JG_07425 [Acutalibacteraceae bacterium]
MKNIIEAIKKFISRISEKTRLSKKMLAAVALLLAGIAALLASELSDAGTTEAVSETQACTANDTAEYERELEERLTSIISAIDGAGNTRVMVTLESGSEDIYLHDFDYGENISPSGKSSIERKDEYVIVDGSAGEGGIIVRVAEPKVRGVAVVCEGGGSELVRQQVTQAVTALLDISSARVSVAKMS